MEEKLAVKSNALDVLEKQLKGRAKRDQFGIIVLSSATDPYLQIESEYQLTRKILELILHYRFPVHVITKSDLVVRDFDILEKINEQAILPTDLRSQLKHKALITFSFSTLDSAVAKVFEPGATPPARRLEAVKKALDSGFHSGVSLMPLLPYITDREESLKLMFETFQNLGIKYVFPASITLFGDGPSDSKTLMLKAIKRHYPYLVSSYEKLFAYGNQPPSWYREEFQNKVTALSQQFNLKRSIIQ